MSLSVASIGECMIELSASGRGDGMWKLGFAGDTFNTLWTLRALIGEAASADYVSAFGDDPFSRDQIAFFRANGMGIAASPVISGARPGLYAITLTGAERSFTYWRGDAAARRLAEDEAALERSLAGRSLVYFSGITLAILDAQARSSLLAALRTARDSGAIVAFDPNYRARLWPDAATARTAIDEALAVSDIALPTFPDEQELHADATPADTAARLRRLGVGEVVVKNGEYPCLVAVKDERYEHAALKVDAVDTTGAGDAFNGGYLAARLSGDDPRAAAARAHRVAGAVVQVRGALAPFETLRTAFQT